MGTILLTKEIHEKLRIIASTKKIKIKDLMDQILFEYLNQPQQANILLNIDKLLEEGKKNQEAFK